MQEREADARIAKLKKQTALFCLYMIKLYQIFISPLKPRVCRFYPTCSQYFYEAIQKKGFLKGAVMGFRRIICCHPFHPGGYDPVK